jgi:hypothetical protein
MDRVFSLVKNGEAAATAPGRRPGAGGGRLPCLSCHISNGTIEKVNKLNGSHKKTAHALVGEIQGLAAEFGLEKLGLLTFTFADHVTDIREAQRRFNSLNTGVLKRRYSRAVAVWERQKSGRIHFHLVVVVGADIRTGADFGQFANRVYTSASKALRLEWSFWRLTAPRYGFGRTELLPVKSTAEGISLYVGKYISKHVGQRLAADAGAKTVRYIGFKPGQRKFNSHFSWADPVWRAKLSAFAASLGVSSSYELKAMFGPRWRFLLNDQIAATEPRSGVALTIEQSQREFLARTRQWFVGYQALELHRRNSGSTSSRDYFLRPSESPPLLSPPTIPNSGDGSKNPCSRTEPAPGQEDILWRETPSAKRVSCAA